MFDILNSTFNTYKHSWISNLRHSGNQISITGITSDREHVSRLAANLPNSRIRRVTNSKIRDQVVWIFEMDFSLPELDWVDLISAEYRPQTTAQSRYRPARSTRSVAPEAREQLEPAIRYEYGMLPRFNSENTPELDSPEVAYNEAALELYNKFAKAINKGDMLEYRFIGHSIINNHPESRLIPLVRWWLAYRLYLDQEFRLADDVLKPNLQRADRYHSYNLLLKARLDYVAENRRFLQLYESLLVDHPHSRAARQAELDLAIIEKGAER